MHQKLLSLLLVFLVAPLIAVAQPDDQMHQQTQSRIDFEVFKAETEITLKALKENQEKAISNVANARNIQLDFQNQKIDQVSAQIDQFSIVAGIMGLLVTVVLFTIGFFTYRYSRDDAVNTAKETAENWFKDSESVKFLEQEIKSLREELARIKESA